jgi:hypothetical protein
LGNSLFDFKPYGGGISNFPQQIAPADFEEKLCSYRGGGHLFDEEFGESRTLSSPLLGQGDFLLFVWPWFASILTIVCCTPRGGSAFRFFMDKANMHSGFLPGRIAFVISRRWDMVVLSDGIERGTTQASNDARQCGQERHTTATFGHLAEG